MYNTIKNELKTKDAMPKDIYGITLGFPKYDSIIFNLEDSCGLNCRNRQDSDYKDKLISFLKSEKSPYKDLSLDEQLTIEKAIKSIDQKKLLDSSKTINLYNGMYCFINFYDDPIEASRLKDAVNNFIETFRLENI